MDPSDRLAFVRGDLVLTELTPEEALAAFNEALEKSRPVLDHLQMEPLSDIAEEWQTLGNGHVTPSSSVRLANVPMLYGVNSDTRLLSLHQGSAIEAVDPEQPDVRSKAYLYLNRKGDVVVWKLALQYATPKPGSMVATLLTPTSFSTVPRSELKVLATQNRMVLLEAVRKLIYSISYAHQRRLKIAEQLQMAAQGLKELGARIGV